MTRSIAFYLALQSVREQDMDLTGWLDYFVAGLATQLTEVTERGKQAIQIDVLIRERGLNARQATALRHVVAHGSMSIQTFEELVPAVNRRTLRAIKRNA